MKVVSYTVPSGSTASTAGSSTLVNFASSVSVDLPQFGVWTWYSTHIRNAVWSVTGGGTLTQFTLFGTLVPGGQGFTIGALKSAGVSDGWHFQGAQFASNASSFNSAATSGGIGSFSGAAGTINWTSAVADLYFYPSALHLF